MSLLDDARRLLPIQPLEEDGEDWYCRVCGERIGEYPLFEGHEPDCAWLALPRIVAALEAADRLLGRFDDYDFPGRAPIPADMRRLIESLGVLLAGDTAP